MIAITAVRAISCPNVGPTELDEKSARATPNRLSSARSSVTSIFSANE